MMDTDDAYSRALERITERYVPRSQRRSQKCLKA
jgi:hypothetical protein